MAVLSYNLSPTLLGNIKNIDLLRQKILLTPLSPKTELRHIWEAHLERIYWSMALSGNQASKNLIGEIISGHHSKKLTNEEREVVNYKDALIYLRHTWKVTPQVLSAAHIKRLYDIACKPTLGGSTSSFASSKAELNHLLGYLDTGKEHPVIQAGILQIHLLGLAPFKEGNGRVSRLASYLILYKHGFDVRDLLVFEEFLRRDLVAFREAAESVRKYKNYTMWLEYFAYGVNRQLGNTYNDITSGKFTTTLPSSVWKLNDRQKRILEILENPDEKITNKQVQDLFEISQITASRDLSKLASLGLLFSHGKGRSVYYTRV